MAILTMNQITVYGLLEHRKAVLEELHRREAVEVRTLDTEALDLRRQDVTGRVSQFDTYCATVEAALAVLDEAAPEKRGLLAGRKPLPLTQYPMRTQDSDAVLKTAYGLVSLSKKIQQNREDLARIRAKQAALRPYLPLDIAMNTAGTRTAASRLGVFAGLWTRERLEREMEACELTQAVYEILSADKTQTCVWFLFSRAQQAQWEAFQRAVGMTEPSFSLSHRTAADKTQVLEEAHGRLSAEIEQWREQIAGMADQRGALELLYDHLELRREKYRVLAQLGMTEKTFILSGYIPEKYAGTLKESLERDFAVFIELEQPDDPEEAPVAFQNNAFAAPVESITQTYSMPSPRDIDPNPVMSFFYYLFFGMMFSDAGYGILLMIVCGILGFGKTLERRRRNQFRMFFYCGVSTTLWGFLYGSFFGDVVHTFSVTFLGRDVALKPLWLDPLSNVLFLLIFSVAIGLIQILVGLGIRFYMLCRQKKVWDAIFDVGFWMLVLAGAGVFAAGFGLKQSLLSNIGMGMAAGGAAGLVVTQGRHSKKVVGKIFGGVISLYDITSYISDVLSYSRLMALGLATGVIGNVVNLLGTLFGGSLFGGVLFAVIFLIGHTANFAINMLGAYVHTNRLQYVEFFSKFYEGGGRKFSPFAMDTKYYHFCDEGE